MTTDMMAENGETFAPDTQHPQRIIKRRKLHEEVADLLLRDIRNGHYQEGEYLPSESALMKEFGVGRPAVRDSLAKLARMGLLELKPGVRPKVCKPDVAPMMQELHGVVKMVLDDPEGQKNLQQIRLLLESALARFSARAIDQRQLAVTRELLDEFRNVMEESPERTRPVIARLSDLDFKFHRSIVDVVKNPLVSLLQQSLFDWLVDQRTSTLAAPNQAEIVYAAHLRIYNGLAARDPDTAEREMIEHLDQVNTVYHNRV